jgi:hypothetical protein
MYAISKVKQNVGSIRACEDQYVQQRQLQLLSDEWQQQQWLLQSRLQGASGLVINRGMSTKMPLSAHETAAAHNPSAPQRKPEEPDNSWAL